MPDVDLQRQVREIERLAGELETIADPAVRARAIELVSLVLDVHGAGLRRVIELIVHSGAAGREMLAHWADDPLVAGLLLLYGLHPRNLESRVLAALDKARPLLRSHGGDVELLSCAGGIVELRLTGSCHGCPSSTLTLRQSIEQALCELAPDVLELRVEGIAGEHAAPATGIVALELLPAGAVS